MVFFAVPTGARMSENSTHLLKALQAGLQALGLELPPGAQEKLIVYIELLAKWNQAYNLTAVRDPGQMIARHLLDSLAILPLVRGPRVLDIGSGAGLPGIPLALARPDLQFALLDSNAKKTRFVIQVVAELGLKNVEVVHSRVENYRPAAKFDTLIARAFAGIADMLGVSAPLCAPGGRWLAMKGVYPQQELAAIPPDYQVETRRLQVPGLDAERHVVIITPK
jgi:16S rRNA (guanine527-N7)-methyltransferase